MNNTYGFIINTLKSYPGNYPLKPQNWNEFISISSRNRLLPIIYKVLEEPSLEKEYKKTAAASLIYEHEIERIFNQFNSCGIKTILLRGLYLGYTIYNDPSLRPFTDIDILIEKNNIEKAKKALKELGYYYSPFLFPEESFLDIHLHLVYYHPKYKIPCELHWAIDHPFSQYDIKMEEVFETAFPIKLGEILCFDIKLELQFILLLIHIHKHLPYLKYLYNNPDIHQYIIKDGELLHILDAYLFLKAHSDDFNWPIFIEKAIGWNVDGVMYSTLKTIERIFDPCLPAGLFEKINPPVQRPLERFLYKNAAIIGSTKLISKISRRLIFTPKRLPDLYSWFFPDKRTIVRKNKLISNRLIFWYYIKNFVCCLLRILNLGIKYAQSTRRNRMKKGGKLYKKTSGSVVKRHIADEIILVPIRKSAEELDSIFTINKVAERIWELIDGEKSIKEIKDILLEEYDVNPEALDKDIEEFINQLQQADLIEPK